MSVCMVNGGSRSSSGGRNRGFFGGHGSHDASNAQTHIGKWVQTAETVCIAQGAFLVTKYNVRFVSHVLTTIALTDIVGFKWYHNAIELQYEGREGRDYYSMRDGEMAAAILLAARRNLDPPDEPYR